MNKITCYFCHVKLLQRRFYLHINRHTEEKPFKCLHCNLWFSSAVVRDRHILNTHKIHLHHKCSFCGISKVTLDDLNCHIQRVHTKDGKKFKCYFCKSFHKWFVTPTWLCTQMNSIISANSVLSNTRAISD